ncbi:ABC transporter permease [Candidatus Bipolaricaulota sp. J31]
MLIIAKRALLAVLTIVVVSIVTFLVIQNVPGDPLYEWAMDMVQTSGLDFETAYKIAAQMYGYDPNQPLLHRLAIYLKRLLQGNLGYSMIYRASVNEIIAKALPWTAFVVSTALLLSFTIGAALGTAIAWKRRSLLDPIVTGYASLTAATPDYVTAMLLLLFFAIRLKWFPSRGAYDIGLTPGFNLEFIANVLYHAALPILAYTIEGIGGWALAMKGSAISVLGEDYIMAAKARGLKDRRIVTAYLARNSILPLVTTLAISFGGMFGGSILIETIFNYPGMGWFFSQALMRKDYGMLQGLFLLTITATILANFLADILYAKLDPRVRLEGGR